MNLALNMIVGPGDASLLDRCLKAFDAKKTFTEIVLVPTCDDVDVWQMCKQWTDKVYGFNWETKRYPFGNFAGARNTALLNTQAPFVMWLDCDDLPSPGFSNLFTAIEPVADKFDVFTLDYVVQVESSLITRRERIFRRTPTLFWQYPVHEQLSIDRTRHRIAHLGNINVQHAPKKNELKSSSRNIRILEHEHKVDPDSFAAAYYYARELLNYDEPKALDLLKGLIDKHESGKPDLLAQVCLLLCENAYREKDTTLLQTYARIGLSFNANYADFHIYLGELYEDKGDTKQAIDAYKKALSVEFTGGGIYNAPMYSLVPAAKLMSIYTQRGDYEAALVMSKSVMQYTGRNERHMVVAERKRLAEEIIKQCRV